MLARLGIGSVMAAIEPLLLPDRGLRANNIFVIIPKWSKSRRAARVLFCTKVGKRVVMLHSFVKKSDRTPKTERTIALARLKEVKDANP